MTDAIEKEAGDFDKEVESGFDDATEQLEQLANFKRDFIANGQKAGVLGVNAANNDLNDLVSVGGNGKRDHIANDQKAGVVGVNALNNDLNDLVSVGENGKRDFIANDQQAGVLGLGLLNNDLNGLIRVGGNNYNKRDALDPVDDAKKTKDFFEQAAKEVS